MKLIKKYGGGNGGFQQVPDWMQPYLADQLETTKQAYTSGAMAPLAGFNDLQTAAGQGLVQAATGPGGQADVASSSVGALNQLGRIAGGETIVPATTGATDAIKAEAIRQAGIQAAPLAAKEAAMGQIGGSRQAIAGGEREAQLAGNLAGIDYKDLQMREQAAQQAAAQAISSGTTVQSQLTAPGQTVAAVGKQVQEMEQKQAEQPLMALQNLTASLKGTPWQSQTQFAK